MKTITIKQPWASLIVKQDTKNPGFGIKPIENRTWPTKFRGRVLIHASANTAEFTDLLAVSSELYIYSCSLRDNHEEFKKYPHSAIIGSIEIIDCVLNHESAWAEHKATVQRKIKGQKVFVEVPVYNWVLANPIDFPEPIPAKGKLSFWDYPNILAEPEEKDGELFCHCQLPVKEVNQVTGDSRFGYYCKYCGGRWYK